MLPGKNLLLFICLLLPPVLSAKDIVLVEKGKTEYCIIIPEKASNEEKQAAGILRDYIKKISRAELSIYTDDRREVNEEILIGSTNRNRGKSALIQVPSIKGDGYWIKTFNSKILIYGETGSGVFNAVYSFLEDYLGCRRYSPEVEKVPKMQSIKLKEIDDLQVPPAYIRIVNGPYFFDRTYRNWRKLQVIDDLWGTKKEDKYYVHTFDKLLPSDKYFATHPEYFSMINGQRVAWGQLCLSAPDLVKITVDKLREVMLRNPEIKYWSVSQNDNYYHCECPACKATDEAEGSPAGTLLRFVNQVADSFPDKIITTLAYQYTRVPPKITKPASNVMITLCTIELNRSEPIETDSTSRSFITDIEGWSAICNSIMLWDYEVQFTNYLCPFPLFHTLQPNIQFFNKHHVTAHFQQCNIDYGVEFAELKAYLLSKLLWNPDINADAVIDDFLKGYYEEAGPHIRQYFDLIHSELQKHKDKLDIYGTPVWHENTFLSEINLKKYNDIFDKAEKEVANKPEILARVKTARLPIQFSAMEIAKTDLFGERGWYSLKNGKYTLRADMRQMLDNFYAVCKSSRMTHLNENGLSVDNYYKNTLRFIDVQVEGNIAFKMPVNCEPPPDKRYAHLGAAMLTNGVRGTEDYKINWLGWEGQDPVITLDLKRDTLFNEITLSSLQFPKSWILHPLRVTFLTSSDGKTWNTIGSAAPEFELKDLKRETPIRNYTVKPGKTKARYVRMLVNATKILPDWHPYHGNKSWVFIDEITIK